MRTKKDAPSTINPAEWRLIGSVQHQGLIYSRGERLPATFTVAEVERAVRSGDVISLQGEIAPMVSSAEKPAVGSLSLSAIIRNRDVIVMQLLRQRGMAEDELEAMLDLAVLNRREVLVQALHLALRHPMDPGVMGKVAVG